MVTGVSRSGKSTLMQDVLYNALAALKHRPVDPPGKHRAIAGHELVKDVVLVDQSPSGRTARSNPGSYIGAFDGIRKLFAAEPLSRERGYTACTLSFNSGTGRCPTCSCSWFEHIEMQFLSHLYLRLPECDGRRFRQEVLEVRLFPVRASGVRSAVDDHRQKARSVSDVLDMTVCEACEFFSESPEILSALAPLAAAGLGYVSLGRPVPTLSGGEAQRPKLAGFLGEPAPGRDGKGNLLLLLPHRQRVFTFPKVLRVFFRNDRRLYGQISKLVYRMTRRYYNEAAGRRIQGAAVIAFASAGDFARFNPHLHAIFLEGGFDR